MRASSPQLIGKEQLAGKKNESSLMQKDGMRAKDSAPALLRCWENSQGLFSHPSAMREGSRGVWALAKEKGLIGPTDWFRENLHLERVSAPPGRGWSKDSRSRAISAALPPRPAPSTRVQPSLSWVQATNPLQPQSLQKYTQPHLVDQRNVFWRHCLEDL